MSSANIPRLDLFDFTKGDESKREKFRQDIGKAFQEIGFVTITNHGLSQELIDELYRQVKAFFDLPSDIKNKYEFPNLAGQRGYTSKGNEKAKDAKTPDLKEFWQLGQPNRIDKNSCDDYLENIVLDELPKFNLITTEVFEKLELAGRQILKAIAMYLGLEEKYFEEQVIQGNSILRALHYFPIESPEDLPLGAVRAGAHEDINLITLLIGASADGLEVLTKNGEWLPIRAKGEDIVVNVGDMLQRLTNNKLKSTTHRVVNPAAEQMKSSRYSVPFFLHPNSSMSLACLPGCVDEDNLKQYEDYTAGEYLEERLREIGLKM